MGGKDDKGTVGIAGLGIMGGAIGRNLAAAGWQVFGYDTDGARCRELETAGVKIASGAIELANAAPVILTSLPNPGALIDTARTIASAGVAKRVVAELSTLALRDKEEAGKILRDAGHVLLDCPISGTGAQAATKDIVIYASGEPGSIAALQPLFSDFARATHDLGAFGNGTRMKFVANLLVAIHNVATAEAFVLGIKAGLEPDLIYRMIRSGVGNSRVFELRGPMMVEDDYEKVTMKLSVWQKDMAAIGEFARGLGCPTPLFDATAPIYGAALEKGLGAQDTAAVCRVLEALGGIERAPRK
jgi:3-hydroxyisobutyrate dehydrogenase-like beta-hydroxyacid dehydrogenase